ncbi:MAG: hypothetical protein AMXMBFR84_47420 [Candidatus Hydrogenedentota bacterium]
MRTEQTKMTLGETYAATRLPSRGDPRLKEFYGDRVEDTVGKEFSSQLNSVAHQPAGSCAMNLLWSYAPNDAPDKKQDRLCLMARGASRDKAIVEGIDGWLSKGSLDGLYAIKRTEPAHIDFSVFSAACDIVRMEQALSPVTTAGENPNVPSLLYEPFPFIPQSRNELLLVDRTFNTVQEPVLIYIGVEPEDTTPQRHALAKHCALLNEIGRAHRPFDDSHALHEAVGDERRRLLPLPYRKEPAADLVARSTQRVRENLRGPSVHFIIRVLATRVATARTVASSLAMAAFKDASYALVVTPCGDPDFGNLVDAVRYGHVEYLRPFEYLAAQGMPAYYRDLQNLRQLASPQELRGIFQWPVADVVSPYCIYHSMDSTVSASDIFFSFGDVVVGPRGELGRKEGVLESESSQSAIALGIPGSGKTLSLITISFESHRCGVPFLYIAPIAGEQTGLKLLHDHSDPNVRRLAQDLQYYTFGPEGVSEGAFNPFTWKKGIPLDLKVRGVAECIMGSLPSFPAFERALVKSIYKLYRRYPDPDNPPRMEMLLPELRSQVKKLGYAGDTSQNLMSASLTRLEKLFTGALRTIFLPGINVPSMDSLIHGYTILDLDGLGDDEKSILMQFILRGIEEYLLTSHSDPCQGEG